MVAALSAVIPAARAVSGKRATNINAYDLFARGRALVNQSLESNIAARPLLKRAIELDPEFADAHACLALSHLCGWVLWGEPTQPNSF
jgi:hypothetical protein